MALARSVLVLWGVDDILVDTRGPGGALPGAARALAALSREPGLVQSVVTRDLRQVVGGKLAALDLDRYLDLAVGAYGEDGGLVAVALRRAAASYGQVFDQDNTFVIGASSHDVDAALTAGAQAIGVSSRGEPSHQLRDMGAVTTWFDLTDTAAFVAFLVPQGRPAGG